jgi:hypothetical protein
MPELNLDKRDTFGSINRQVDAMPFADHAESPFKLQKVTDEVKSEHTLGPKRQWDAIDLLAYIVAGCFESGDKCVADCHHFGSSPMRIHDCSGLHRRPA